MLSVPANWLAAFQKDARTISALVTITVDPSTSFRFAFSQSRPALYAAGSTPIEFSVKGIKPLTSVLDPLTRRVSIGRVSVEFVDPGLRNMIRLRRLKGKAIDIKIGTFALGEADYAPYFKGEIVDANPVLGGTVLECADTRAAQLDNLVSIASLGEHPLEVIDELLRFNGNIPLALIDSGGTLNPDADTTISHFVVSRAANGNEYEISPEPTPVRELVNELAETMLGSVVPGEDGVLRFTRYIASTPAVRTWNRDDISGLRQVSSTKNIFNRVTYMMGWRGGGKFRRDLGWPDLVPNNADALALQTMQDFTEYLYRLSRDDTDSQAAHAYPGQAKQVYEHVTDSRWLGATTYLLFASGTGAETFHCEGGNVAGFSGLRDYDKTTPPPHVPEPARISAARPAYLLIGDPSQRFEIVRAESVTVDEHWEAHYTTDAARALVDFDIVPKPPNGIIPVRASFDVPSGGRDIFDLNGTSGVGITFSAWNGLTYTGARVVDITIPVFALQTLLDRYSDGMPILEFNTRLTEYEVQLGDFVVIKHDLPNFLGFDGITSGGVWEVISKEVEFTASPPKIKWTVAFVKTGVTFVEQWETSDLIRAEPIQQNARKSEAGTTWQKHVSQGLSITSAGSSPPRISIAAGESHGASSVVGFDDATVLVMVPSRDNYVSVDQRIHSFTVQDVAVGSAAPTVGEYEVRLARVTTDATSVTSIFDLRDLKSVNALQLVKGSQTDQSANLDSELQRTLVPNGNFGYASRTVIQNNDTTFDRWQMTAGVWPTDASVETTVTRTGARSLRLGPTALAAELTADPFPVEGGASYFGSVRAQADSAAASALAHFELVWLDGNKASIGTAIIFSGKMTAAGTWESFRNVVNAPTGARYAHARLRKAAFAFSLYVDSFLLARARNEVLAFLSTAQTIEQNKKTPIPYNSVQYDFGGLFTPGVIDAVGPPFDPTGGRLTVRRKGTYDIGARMVIKGINSNSRVELIAQKDTGSGFADLCLLDSKVSVNNPDDVLVTGNCRVQLNAGDIIRTTITHGSNKPEILDTGTVKTSLTIRQMEES